MSKTCKVKVEGTVIVTAEYEMEADDENEAISEARELFDENLLVSAGDSESYDFFIDEHEATVVD